jgi:20S proteasome subunit beta 6
MTDKTIMATSGMFADFCELRKVLAAKLEIYDYKIERQPTTESFAHLLSKTLYGRRFFPYYTFNLVAGLDKNGKGIVYGYDAIGSYGPDRALAQGSGAHMILPFLDAEVSGYNNPNQSQKPPLSPERAVELVYEAFKAAAERDIYTGDKLEIILLDKNGAKTEWRQLRRD